MAEFQKVMRQWNRVCNSVPDKHGQNLCSDKKTGYICPMHDCGLCNKSVKNQTDDDRLEGEKIIMSWAAKYPEPVYPTWEEWLQSIGVMESSEGLLRRIKAQLYIDGIPAHAVPTSKVLQPIPADIAQKLGIEPKEG